MCSRADNVDYISGQNGDDIYIPVNSTAVPRNSGDESLNFQVVCPQNGPAVRVLKRGKNALQGGLVQVRTWAFVSIAVREPGEKNQGHRNPMDKIQNRDTVPNPFINRSAVPFWLQTI